MARSEYRCCPPRPAAPAGRPGSDRLRGHPHRHIAASNEGLVIGRPVRNAILRLIRGMNLRLHPRSVAPAEGPEKCGPRRPTRSGYSCNNAPNEGPVIGRPVHNAVLRLVSGMDLRLHPCSVAPAECHEKCGPNRPTPTGYSCNNAMRRQRTSPREHLRRRCPPP